MNLPDISDALFGQGDVMRAVRAIVDHRLPLTPEGATECERVIREHGEGFRQKWAHPRWLPQTIAMAQAIVEAVRKGPGH